MIRAGVAALLLLAFAAGCGRQDDVPADPAAPAAADVDAGATVRGDGSVTISGDDRIAASLTWHAPEITLVADEVAPARRRADRAFAAGRLYEDAEAAIPLYLAVLAQVPEDAAATAGLQRAMARLLADGR
ncbi:hypothetical protein BH23PSE2_BH23PSE2_12750 [soil metagenome]